MTRKEIILKTLCEDIAFTALDIFKTMSLAEKAKFDHDERTVGKYLSMLKKDGAVENGESEVIGGRMKFTWKLKKGYEQMTELQIPEAPELQIPEAPELHAPDVPELQIPEAPELQIPEAPELQIPETVLLDAKDRIVIDPSEEPLAYEVVKALRNQPSPITDKELKIATLERLSGIVADDIQQVLLRIVDDLQR